MADLFTSSEGIVVFFQEAELLVNQIQDRNEEEDCAVNFLFY